MIAKFKATGKGLAEARQRRTQAGQGRPALTGNFARRLNEWVLYRALTQDILADRSELPVTVVHALITGQREPTPSEVERLAKALKISVNDLVESSWPMSLGMGSKHGTPEWFHRRRPLWISRGQAAPFWRLASQDDHASIATLESLSAGYRFGGLRCVRPAAQHR